MRLEHHSYPAKLEFQRDGGVGRRVIGLDSAQSEGGRGRLLNPCICRYRCSSKCLTWRYRSRTGKASEVKVDRIIEDAGRHCSELAPSNQSPCTYMGISHRSQRPPPVSTSSITRSYIIVFTFLISISTGISFQGHAYRTARMMTIQITPSGSKMVKYLPRTSESFYFKWHTRTV